MSEMKVNIAIGTLIDGDGCMHPLRLPSMIVFEMFESRYDSVSVSFCLTFNVIMTTASRIGPLGRLWSRYLVALRDHPIRTKMITSGSLYIVGDNIAQFGIEGRSLVSTEDDRERYDVS